MIDKYTKKQGIQFYFKSNKYKLSGFSTERYLKKKLKCHDFYRLQNFSELGKGSKEYKLSWSTEKRSLRSEITDSTHYPGKHNIDK